VRDALASRNVGRNSYNKKYLKILNIFHDQLCHINYSMIPITCNILNYFMPTEVTYLSVISLLNTLPSNTDVNILSNNFDPIKLYKMLNNKVFEFSFFKKEEIEKLEKFLDKESSFQTIHDLNIIDTDIDFENCNFSKFCNAIITASNTDWILISGYDVMWKYNWFNIFCEQVMKGSMLIASGFNCFLVHKKVFDMIGMFNLNFKHPTYAVTDFLMRIILFGDIRISLKISEYNFDCQLGKHIQLLRNLLPSLKKRLIDYRKKVNVEGILLLHFHESRNAFKKQWHCDIEDDKVDKILQQYQYGFTRGE